MDREGHEGRGGGGRSMDERVGRRVREQIGMSYESMMFIAIKTFFFNYEAESEDEVRFH